jgi:hypothetical protein
MNFLVNPFLLSLNLDFCEPKAVCLMSWILNFIVFPGILGKLISKFGFIKLFVFVKYYNFIKFVYCLRLKKGILKNNENFYNRKIVVIDQFFMS